MECWYKCTKFAVTGSNSTMLSNKPMNLLMEKNAMQIANLYDDGNCYYIKTTNNITLHTFLFMNGFEEIDDNGDMDEYELDMLFGHEYIN